LKVERKSLDAGTLRDGQARQWLSVKELKIPMSPSPIALTESVSPYMAKTSGHGIVARLSIRMTHDGETLSLRLSWFDANKDDELTDLDQFSDAIAVMFPLSAGASAFSMGSTDKPVNAWFWKADEQQPYDVIARGYATSDRRGAESSGLLAMAQYQDNHWTVVLQRPLQSKNLESVSLLPGVDTAIAFAVWEGGNAERSAQKSVSGEFVRLTIQ
jgi:DMSO reductase family type II enzyme heme b subunit